MANKKVPTEIAGQTLCEESQARMNQLIAALEAAGAVGISSELSHTDRFRLLAHYYFMETKIADVVEELVIAPVGSVVRIGMQEVLSNKD